MSYQRPRLDDATEAAIAAEVARQRDRFKPSDFDQAVRLLRAYDRTTINRQSERSVA